MQSLGLKFLSLILTGQRNFTDYEMPEMEMSPNRMGNGVEKSGSKIKLPKTLIVEDMGFMSFFFDTEGNEIGLHSNG